MANDAAMDDYAVSSVVPVNMPLMPSVATGRLLTLIAAMLATGLFAGTAMFDAVAGGSLRAAAAACSRLPLDMPPDRLDAFSICVASTTVQRAFFAVGGAAIVVVSVLAVLFVAPVIIEHRQGLRLPGPSLAMAVERVQALAQNIGVQRPPNVVVGPTALQDAFCYGRPGRYTVALPTGLAAHPLSADFDAAVRRELARIARQDIALPSITHLAWYQFAALLLPSVALSLAHRDLSVLPDYAWRVAVLAAVVLLAQRAVLRFRKYGSDLQADQVLAAKQSMTTVLPLIWDASVTLLQRILARHLSLTGTFDMLRKPGRATVVTFADGAVSAFLATIILPCLDSILQVVFPVDAYVKLVPLVSAILVSLIVGATVGIGLCRESLLSRGTDTGTPVIKVTLGMFVGSVMGQGVLFADVTPSIVHGSGRPLPMLMVALSVAGTTVVAAGLIDIWRDITSYFGRPSKALFVTTVLNTALFSMILWVSDILRTALDLGGWSLASEAIWASMTNALVIILALILAAAAGWALWATTKVAMRAPASIIRSSIRPHAVLRAWQTLVVSAISGLAATTVAVSFHMMAGSHNGQVDQLQQFHTYVLMTAVVGAVAALSLSLINGLSGCGASLLAVPITATVVCTGFFIQNAWTSEACIPNPSFRILAPAIGLGFLLYVTTAWLALIASWIRIQLRATLIITLVTVMATGAALSIIGEHDILVPKVNQSSPMSPTYVVTTGQVIHDYKVRVGPDFFTRRLQLNRKSLNIDDDLSLSNANRGALYRGEIIAPLQQILTRAESYIPPSDRVMIAHQHCISALRLAVAANEKFALGYELNNQMMFKQGLTMLDIELKEWQVWLDAVSHL